MGQPVDPAVLRPPRMADLVADRLRQRILSGDLDDGDLLPKEEELREEFPVSKPSIREAMRILEAEGLVTVRRGNRGGAVVHKPTQAHAAYTLGLVLAASSVEIDDVAQALREVEPICAALCAQRPDRMTTVVPLLEAAHEKTMTQVEALINATRGSRSFHETMVQQCGNRTLAVVVGAMEKMWSAHERSWAEWAEEEEDPIPIEQRLEALDAHRQLIDLIAAGDATGARRLAEEHLASVQLYPASRQGSNEINIASLKPFG